MSAPNAPNAPNAANAPRATPRSQRLGRRAFALRAAGWVAFLHAAAATAATGGGDRFAVAGTSEADVRIFVENLQRALRENDAEAAARLFDLPCPVWIGHRTIRIAQRAQAVSFHHLIFDPALKELVATARPEALFVNWQGVMLGNGRLWFAPTGLRNRLAIIAVNPPDEPAANRR